MLKRITGVIGIAFGMFMLIAFTAKSPVPPKQRSPLGTIIIDPGHGGRDPGTIGQISRESRVSLAISLKLGKAIKAAFPDTKVLYTRTTDILPGNKTLKESYYYRSDFANSANGDLFISIHCNSIGKKPGGWYEKKIVSYKKVTTGKGKKKKTKQVPVYKSYYVKNTHKGTETYIWAADRGQLKGDAINQRQEESGEKADSALSFDMSSPEARIRAQLYEKKYFAKSLLLGNFVEEAFEKGGRNSFGVKQRNQEGIWVLQATGMPSILVETGFLSNTEEEKYLNSEKGQQGVVSAIVSALKKYKSAIENGK
ncbi:N-acetylmuramoyl-L-alanine amidase [Paraflavitalea sp. CAU 1676]|uniref:N-acetylmuramoyl-L-alanine amidase family protein n=1 Tax=Paraflavitalea sp. CAU 1676 TaxID=3032598 RepID=UPI0023DC327B|nr:N-acetylmuramoyl-L-alanine amidase [Paraflavitalea sp. CAU 1676]MDF2192820.1 N-acetylmuramoyl-L-alanine amidase [Paraflavitalea sp. CAU 1676]